MFCTSDHKAGDELNPQSPSYEGCIYYEQSLMACENDNAQAYWEEATEVVSSVCR